MRTYRFLLLALVLLCLFGGSVFGQFVLAPALFSNAATPVGPGFVVDLPSIAVPPATITVELTAPVGSFEVYFSPVAPLVTGIPTPLGLLFIDPIAGFTVLLSGVGNSTTQTLLTLPTASLPPGLDITLQAVTGGTTVVSTFLHILT